MATRRSKPRKTADRMAVYKAAASKNRQSPGSRSSPRTVRKISMNTATRTSPRNGSSSSREKRNTGACSSAQKVGLHSIVGNSPGLPGTSQIHNDNASNGSPLSTASADVGSTRGREEMPLTDEVIPETPPREPVSRNRKRILAPMDGEISNEHGDGEVEGAKPTKKRKIFQTPPREEGSSTEPSSLAEVNEGGGGFPRGTEFAESLDDDDDDALEPPLAPVRMRRTLPLRRRLDGSSLSRVAAGQGDGVRFHRSAHNGDGLSRKASAERSVSDKLSLDMVTTSSATLSRMFDRFTTTVSREIEDLRITHLAELRKVGEELKSHLASEVRNIQALVEMMSGGMKNGAAVRTGGNISLRDWEKLLDGLTPYATVVFTKDLFARILSFNAPLKAVDTYVKYGGCGISDVERASLSAQTLLFRLQPADKKFQYLEDVGKLHSEFKFSVVRNAFFNVGLDTFGLFKHGSSREHERQQERSVNSATDLSGKIMRPSWLAEGSVTLDHINQARVLTEAAGQSRREKIRRTPSPDDIACHGALRVYRQLSKILHDGRGNLRISFFQNLGYLLLPWKGRTADVDQHSMNMEFPEGDGPDDMELLMTLEDIPLTTQCPQNADENTVRTADASNKKLLKNLFGQWRGMVLAVDHDVIVSQGGQKKTVKSEKKRLHRLIHLVDVALDCCVEFCRTADRESFLRSNKKSLRCVMLFAVLFKAICLEFMSMCQYSSSACTVPEPTEVKVYGTCLKDLIPGLSTQKSILTHKCINLPLNVFETLDHGAAETEVVSEEMDALDPVFDMRRIEESAEEGVCPI